MFNLRVVKTKSLINDPVSDRKFPFVLIWDEVFIDPDTGKYCKAIAKEGHWIRFAFRAIYCEIKWFMNKKKGS